MSALLSIAMLRKTKTATTCSGSARPRPGVGYFYALTPVYLANRLRALLGVEQPIRMENFFTPGSLPMGVTILDENGHALISLTGPEGNIKAEPHWMQERSGLATRRVSASWY